MLPALPPGPVPDACGALPPPPGAPPKPELLPPPPAGALGAPAELSEDSRVTGAGEAGNPEDR